MGSMSIAQSRWHREWHPSLASFDSNYQQVFQYQAPIYSHRPYERVCSYIGFSLVLIPPSALANRVHRPRPSSPCPADASLSCSTRAPSLTFFLCLILRLFFSPSKNPSLLTFLRYIRFYFYPSVTLRTMPDRRRDHTWSLSCGCSKIASLFSWFAFSGFSMIQWFNNSTI